MGISVHQSLSQSQVIQSKSKITVDLMRIGDWPRSTNLPNNQQIGHTKYRIRLEITWNIRNTPEMEIRKNRELLNTPKIAMEYNWRTQKNIANQGTEFAPGQLKNGLDL